MSRFNPRAFWQSLNRKQRSKIGEAALLLSLAGDAPDALDEDLDLALIRKLQHAEQEAWGILGNFAPDVIDYSDGLDLAAIDIRTCRVCGCTDNSGCIEGCSWIGPDLCSRCGDAP